jgi:CRP-like cAMP-binding protein
MENLQTEIRAVPSQRRIRNAILAQLPEEEYLRLEPALQPVELVIGAGISRPGEPIEYVYFPDSGLISTDAVTSDGESVEVEVVGRESFTGLPALYNQPQMSHMVIVQGAGYGHRIRPSILREVFLQGGELRRLVHNASYLQMVQISQSVLCNRLHDVEARLARWLLTSADRMETEQLQLTQEFLAQMLGVQRSTVTVAAGVLQRGGMIEYSRGRIAILNRAMLKDSACECYGIVDGAYRRILKRDSEGNLFYV